MGDRQRGRDTRNNSNKCYTMFFEEDFQDRKASKISPKKRESPKKKSISVPVNTTLGNSDVKEEDTAKHVHLVKSESCERAAESGKRKFSCTESNCGLKQEVRSKKVKISSQRNQMFELFQPWALKTYGDQAKTKTITLKKKARILKALDGKEQNNPDSSKFRFWVKSKGFTTRIPENFVNSAVNPNEDTLKDHVDLYVASVTKDFGERTYRKVAVVEDFFNIIYNVHVELGGRNGRHAGQKRTYRIITETYAFLPREAVTKFLSGCPACKKNLRPFSPSRFDEHFTESSSEFEALNYSSQNDSSVDSTQLETSKLRPTVKEEVVQENLSVSKLTETKDNYSEKLSTTQDETIKNSGRVEVKSESDLVVEDAASKIPEYWKLSNSSNSPSDDNILNYYQFLKKFCGYPTKDGWMSSDCNPLLAKKLANAKIGRASPIRPIRQPSPLTDMSKNQNFPRNDCSASTIDLTIKPIDKSSQSININIENSITPTNTGTSLGKLPNSHSTYMNSVDVSINMSTNINELKISCKTTPPKKRYSVYKPEPIQTLEDNEQKCATDLSQEFSKVETKYDDKSHVTDRSISKDVKRPFQVDLCKVKPITSTYLKMTRSLGLSDEDALKIDDLETLPTTGPDSIPDNSTEEPYAGLMKETDKLKLMLLAWNYQNSNAVRNGSEAPDLGVVGGLWAQYQNALALNTKQSSVSPVHRPEQSSPIENQDETNSSGQKDEDDGSEDDSDDKLDQNAQDPERLKAFNMFVRLFVDENLDRMIPISKQPKEKIQAIIDSCARQFPEFCERSRKRIRTYLKSCRRNKKAREGWDNTSRPTPAHLTSVQAEQILAIACENESMNAKRMRVGLDPISQAMPLPSAATNPVETIAPSAPYPNFRTTPNSTANTTDSETPTPSTTAQTVNTARSSPLSLNTSGNEAKPVTVAASVTTNSQVSSPLYRPADFASPSSTSSPYSSRPQTYPPFFPNASSNIATPTDLSMKQHQQQQPSQTLPSAGASPTPRPPIVTHKLSANEITAARQVITAYRESAAFLLRTADQVEQLLLQQQ